MRIGVVGTLVLLSAITASICTNVTWAQSLPSVSINEEERGWTGEVVAMWCLLREGAFGIGRLNENRQRNCILRGSPIALKVDRTFYTISPESEDVKNRLATLAGYKVTVRGSVTTLNSRPIILVSYVERAKR